MAFFAGPKPSSPELPSPQTYTFSRVVGALLMTFFGLGLGATAGLVTLGFLFSETDSSPTDSALRFLGAGGLVVLLGVVFVLRDFAGSLALAFAGAVVVFFAVVLAFVVVPFVVAAVAFFAVVAAVAVVEALLVLEDLAGAFGAAAVVCFLGAMVRLRDKAITSLRVYVCVYEWLGVHF